MLEFRLSADPHSKDIVRDGTPLGCAQWHRSRKKRIIIWSKPGTELTLAELEQCVEFLQGQTARPGPDPDVELAREVTNAEGDRKARVDYNRVSDCTDEGRYAVFKRTRYQYRWYYDGYRDFEYLEEAIRFRDCWLERKPWKPEESNTSPPGTSCSSSSPSSPPESAGP